MLARIVKGAKDEDVRRQAISAIGDMRHPGALDALADLLSDPDPDLKSEALTAIKDITHAPECRLGEGEEASIESCKVWWAEEGKSTEWPIPADLAPE